MLYKSKRNLSLILLIIGLGIIPSGLFINGYLTDQVSGSVAPFLSAMEDEIVDEIKDEYLGLGIPTNLLKVYNNIIEQIKDDYVLVYGIPSTLIYLRNITLDLLPEFINASRAALNMRDTISDVSSLNSTTTAVARDLYFNNYTFQDDYKSTIEGISERMMGGTESLNYSSLAIGYLLSGRTYNSIYYPGLLKDLTYGTEFLDWLEFYYNAEANIGTNRSLIQTVYNCTWASGQLQNLSAYITTYLWEIIIKADYAPMELETYAELLFYDQWANASWLLTGFNLRIFSEYLSTNLFGLEVGRNNPTNINYISAINLWDPLNSSSFVNDEGILKWFDAFNGNLTAQNDLQEDFMLNVASMPLLYSWLFSIVRINIVPIFYVLPEPIGIGMSISEHADIIFYEQWANGTHNKEGLDVGGGVRGYEVGIPVKTNITLSIVRELLNQSTKSSFSDRDGILKWIEAYEGNITAQNELISEFGLSLTQLSLINNWLFTTFRYNVIPGISATSMISYAQWEFYRQWADGTIFKNGIDPGPFQGLDSLSGWELGIPTKTNIDENTTSFLWRPSNQYSLVNWKGISYWFKAIRDKATYEFLQEYFNTSTIRIGTKYFNTQLSYNQLDAILAWIVDIREIFVLNNIQVLANLPTDNYTLGNNISFVFTVTGGIISAIGVLGIVVLFITKRK